MSAKQTITLKIQSKHTNVQSTTLMVECEIPSLKLVFKLLPSTLPKEENLLYLECLDETCRLVVLVIEAQKRRVKNQYDKSFNPRVFFEGDLVLLTTKPTIIWE